MIIRLGNKDNMSFSLIMSVALYTAISIENIDFCSGYV